MCHEAGLMSERLFHSFFIGEFECSTHRTRDGRRLDLIAATLHDRWAFEDYARLRTSESIQRETVFVGT
jgi:hypothetical protein